jgi:hypothetical protein
MAHLHISGYEVFGGRNYRISTEIDERELTEYGNLCWEDVAEGTYYSSLYATLECRGLSIEIFI